MTITIPNVFVNFTETADATQVNANFNTLVNTANATTSLIQTLTSQFNNLNSQLTTLTSQVTTLTSQFNSFIPSTTNLVTNFGAVGDGITDDSAAIQAAINSLSATGGTILFPPLKYKISSSLIIGNGSASAGSTKNGIYLKGVGIPNKLTFDGFAVNSYPQLVWAGPAADMISVQGPIQGWGLENLQLNGNLSARYGVVVLSGQFGSSRNLSIIDCKAGIYSTTVTAIPPGLTNADSLHNSWDNVSIRVPNVNPAFGIVLTNAQNGIAADTDFNQFSNTTIFLNGGTPNSLFGIYLTNCDDNFFENVHIFGGTAGPLAVVFDYTISGVWPAGNTILHIDPGTLAFANNGVPSGAAPNYLLAMSLTNGAVIPSLANLTVIT